MLNLNITSALYVVDLMRFRELGAGDQIRSAYQQLSGDQNSLSNLDQVRAVELLMSSSGAIDDSPLTQCNEPWITGSAQLPTRPRSYILTAARMAVVRDLVR